MSGLPYTLGGSHVAQSPALTAEVQVANVRAYVARMEEMAAVMTHVHDREIVRSVITDVKRALGDESMPKRPHAHRLGGEV